MLSGFSCLKCDFSSSLSRTLLHIFKFSKTFNEYYILLYALAVQWCIFARTRFRLEARQALSLRKIQLRFHKRHRMFVSNLNEPRIVYALTLAPSRSVAGPHKNRICHARIIVSFP